MVMRHYDVEIRFLGGYSFKRVKPVLRDFALKMFELRKRQSLSPCVRMLMKTVVNSIWGRSLARQKPVYDKLMDASKVEGFLRKNSALVWSVRKAPQKKSAPSPRIRVRLLKCLDLSWQRPQLGVSVSSYARSVMQDLIYKKVFLYCNTDSLLTYTPSPSEKAPLLVGSGLGEFKIEYAGIREFICLGPKKKCLLLGDGSVHNTFGKPSVEWFREQARSVFC
jgi:hypothetical protein